MRQNPEISELESDPIVLSEQAAIIGRLPSPTTVEVDQGRVDQSTVDGLEESLLASAGDDIPIVEMDAPDYLRRLHASGLLGKRGVEEAAIANRRVETSLSQMVRSPLAPEPPRKPIVNWKRMPNGTYVQQ